MDVFPLVSLGTPPKAWYSLGMILCPFFSATGLVNNPLFQGLFNNQRRILEKKKEFLFGSLT